MDQNRYLNYFFLFVLLLWLFIRIVWLSNYPHFYDGFEYFRLSSQNFLVALEHSHASTHPISLLTWQFLQQISFKTVQAISTVSLISSFLGLFTLMAWISYERDKKSALLAGLVYTFLPLNWLVSTNINSESITHFMMFLGLIGWFYSDKHFGWKILAFGGGFLAALNYVGIIWWLFPLLFGSLIIKRRRINTEIWIYLGVGAGLISHVILDILVSSFEKPIAAVKMLSQLNTLLNPIGFLVVGYQIVTAFIYNYSIISLAAFLFLFILFWKEKKINKMLLMTSIGLAYFLSVSFWHGGIYGRLGGFMGYLLPIIFVYFPRNLTKYALFALSIQAIFMMKPYLQVPIGKIQEKMIVNNCQNNKVVISAAESTQMAYEGKKYLITGLDQTKLVEKEIQTQMEEGHDICLTQQALNYPYRQYDGQLPHPLQGSKNDKGELSTWLNNKAVLVAKDDRYPLLGIYKVFSIK